MKKIKNVVIIIIFIFKLVFALPVNSMLFNKLNDSCNIIKLDTFPKEILKVYNEYEIFKKNNRYNKENKLIIFIDFNKINDSTNIYIVTETIFIEELITNMPSYYFIKDSCIIYIYTRKEIIDNKNYKCIEPLINASRQYVIDRNEYHAMTYDPPNVKFIIQKGEITYKNWNTDFPARLYEDNKYKIINH
jgi:hypothetical protein